MLHFPQIITSLLDTDLYKFSMGQAIFHQFPDYTTTWEFKCRNTDVKFTKEMVQEIRYQIYLFCMNSFSKDEIDYLRTIKWLKPSYLKYLKNWKPNFHHFEISTDAECGLSITTRGSWLDTSMYEVPTLAIVNEVYYRMLYKANEYEDLLKNHAVEIFDKKLEWLDKVKPYSFDFNFSEFGTRRRFSKTNQFYIVDKLTQLQRKKDIGFVGTSNVLLAKMMNITPVGTMAHEWIMCVGQGNEKHNPAYSNWYALDAWIKEYGVLNGIALTDTITTDNFLKDFQLTYATLFSGVRHDSGDPFEWGEKMISHYEELGIDPKTKTLLFSDSLDFGLAADIFINFSDRINTAFGIGTYLTNDLGDKEKSLNIVMKVTECNNIPVAKLSDTEGKTMCKNKNYINFLKERIMNRRG